MLDVENRIGIAARVLKFISLLFASDSNTNGFPLAATETAKNLFCVPSETELIYCAVEVLLVNLVSPTTTSGVAGLAVPIPNLLLVLSQNKLADEPNALVPAPKGI